MVDDLAIYICMDKYHLIFMARANNVNNESSNIPIIFNTQDTQTKKKELLNVDLEEMTQVHIILFSHTCTYREGPGDKAIDRPYLYFLH